MGLPELRHSARELDRLADYWEDLPLQAFGRPTPDADDYLYGGMDFGMKRPLPYYGLSKDTDVFATEFMRTSYEIISTQLNRGREQCSVVASDLRAAAAQYLRDEAARQGLTKEIEQVLAEEGLIK